METLALFSAAMSLGFVSGACALCRETELAIATATGLCIVCMLAIVSSLT
jgi:hypothetical protein